ncbi:MAG: glycosyltransferase [Brevinematales bacterium]|nr:glycosyltransferase [Brevinematales bacterium]
MSRPTENIPVSHLLEGKRLSIIMPFYNEGRVIVSHVQQVLDVCKEIGLNVEIVAVDDGSVDDGFEKLSQSFSHNPQVIIVRNDTNFGKGWALKTGYEFSHGEYVLFLDADLELSPWHIPQFLFRLFEQKADAVIGSKLHPESEVNYPTIRRILSKGYYFFIRLLFRLPVMDTQTGIKLFRREALEASLPKTLVKRFAFDIELLVVMIAEGFRIVSAPVCLHFSRGGIGNIRLTTIWNIFFDTLAVVYRFHILHYYKRKLGPPLHYRWRVILFSESMNQKEVANLSRYLTLPYGDYDVVVLGPVSPPFQHPRLYYQEAKENLYASRLRAHPEVIDNTKEGYLLGTLLFSPDKKMFLNSGRLLSLPDVGMIGGFVMPAPDESPKGKFFYSILRSVFLNGPLTYRYKHGVQKTVEELGLEGTMVTRTILEAWFSTPHPTDDKLEHQLSLVCKNRGKLILYSPDVVMFGYFPQTIQEFFHWIASQALIRSHQREGLLTWYLLFSGLFSLWLLVFLAFWITPWLGLPWLFYYGFLIIIWPFSNEEKGIQKPLQGFLLATAQIVYGGSFLFHFIAQKFKKT